MVTFLVHFGFDLRFVLCSDLISLDTLFLSAMRCKYLDKSEDAGTLVAVAGDLYAKKGEAQLPGRFKKWQRIIEARAVRKGAAPASDGRADANEFLHDFRLGFSNLAGAR